MLFSPRNRGTSAAVACLAVALTAITGVAAAQSILPGNFLPNPDMETETRFVEHRHDDPCGCDPTDNSFADYWHHSLYSGWNDITLPLGPHGPEPVVSGLHSLRLFDQDSYYFAPEAFGLGPFRQEEFRTFATEIPLDAASPTGLAQKLWFRWHWNYNMTAPEGGDPSVTLNIRLSNDPITRLDLTNSLGDNKTIRTGSSGGLWEEVTVAIDLATPELMDAQTFDMIFMTQGTTSALGIMFVDDVSVSAINPFINADFDADDDVDGGDFLIWQRGVGLGSQINNSNGDANGDGSVNGSDLTVWKSQFGGPATVTAFGAVPEPATGILALLGVAVALRIRRIRG